MVTLQNLFNIGISFILNSIGAILILVIGVYASFFIRKRLKRFLSKRDEILGNFISQVVFVLVLIVTIVSVLGSLGVQTTSIIAVLGTAGLAIALALKDSLSNLASGIMLIVLRPFKKGDLIETQSILGSVESVELFHTKLRMPDNKLAIFPNGSVVNATIVHYTESEKRRIEWVLGVGYGSDIQKVKDIVFSIIYPMENIANDPEPFVGVSALNSSSIDFSIRVWLKNDVDFFKTRSELIEKTKKALDEEGIEIPYNKLDVNIKKENA